MGVTLRMAALVVMVAALEASPLPDQWAKTFDLTGTPELLLNSSDASIIVTGEDRTNIDARVTTSGWKISQTGVRVLENHGGNRLELVIKTPEQSFSIGHHTVKVELKVPHEIDCEIKSGLGRLSVSNIKGKVGLTAKAGAVEVLGVDGKLEASTGEGRIRARGRFDVVTLSSGYGGIDLEALPGSRLFSEWRVSTDSGNVTLYLPPNLAAKLDAMTDAGHVAVDIPFTVTGTPESTHIQGTLNGGGELLVVHTSGGTIKVAKK